MFRHLGLSPPFECTCAVGYIQKAKGTLWNVTVCVCRTNSRRLKAARRGVRERNTAPFRLMKADPDKDTAARSSASSSSSSIYNIMANQPNDKSLLRSLLLFHRRRRVKRFLLLYHLFPIYTIYFLLLLTAHYTLALCDFPVNEHQESLARVLF